MTPEQRANLISHLQTAVEIELATIPVYLYTYYSINRIPDACDQFKSKANELQTFANQAGGLIMSVAVEEMLHMSLACNILRALGGQPKIYQRSPYPFPHGLPHHAGDFTVGTEKLSKSQLEKFLTIEKPEAVNAPPEGDNWETIGQFYEYIEDCIRTQCSDEDFQNEPHQLNGGHGYYSPNNVDTVYPKSADWVKKTPNPKDPSQLGADEAQYPNNEDSGHLVTVTDKASAIQAIQIIKHQGEGYPEDKEHKGDDPEKNEDSHWYKYNQLYKQIGAFSNDELNCMLYNAPDNPTLDSYSNKYQVIVNLANAVYSYLLWITEVSFTLEKQAQHTMFYVGMHKGMIFILDKIIGGMRANTDADNGNIAVMPTFENYKFSDIKNAKAELVSLAKDALAAGYIYEAILDRIENLPDVYVPEHGIIQFA